MSTEITLRLPDEMVAFLDESVRVGAARSRADAVSRAVEREMRRGAALRDRAILREVGTGDDLDGLAVWSTRHSRELG